MQNPTDKKSAVWLLIGLAVWVVTVPFLSGVMESPAAALGVTLVWLLFPLLYAFVARDGQGIGLTRKKVGRAVAEMLLVTTVYSLIRIGLIVFVPASVDYIAASAIQVARLLKDGQFGSLAGPPALLFPLMFVLTFLAAAGNELFYRGFLFTRMRQHTHWLVALLASAALFGFYHYFNSGLSGAIMGVVVSLVSGWLMQRRNNVVAPVLFHYLQYQAAILVFYFIVLLDSGENWVT